MTRVVYITGQSFSGSTLLCALLGIGPQMEPVSELSKWTTGYVRNPDRSCACGRKSTDCEFWNAVEKRWLTKISLDRYVGLQNEFEHISSIWRNRLANTPRPPADFKEFCEYTVSLYQSLSDVSKRPIIVDSSKLPGRALAIAKMNGLDVSIIHLVRNGVQFLNSSLARGKLISKGDPNILYKSFLLGLNWSVTNISAEYVLRTSKRKGFRIRYEDLVSDPIGIIRRIGSALEIETREIQDHVRRGIPISYRHMATGSAHRSREPKPIKGIYNVIPDVDRRLKIAFALGAGVLSKRYGY